MSARIAPEPISSGISAVSEYYHSRSAASEAHARTAPAQQQAPKQQSMTLPEEPQEKQAPALSPPPAPPGAAFAVALISGQLAPKPTSHLELQMRLGSADLPAQGSLALHDRLA